MNTGATIGGGGGGNGGRALARKGSVTLDGNLITPPPAGCTFVPASSTSTTPTATVTPRPGTPPTPNRPPIPGVPTTGGA